MMDELLEQGSCEQSSPVSGPSCGLRRRGRKTATTVPITTHKFLQLGLLGGVAQHTVEGKSAFSNIL